MITISQDKDESINEFTARASNILGTRVHIEFFPYYGGHYFCEVDRYGNTRRLARAEYY